METIIEAMIQWGELMTLGMANRTLSYSPVLGHWRVKKWTGKDARSFLYDGSNFDEAFKVLVGTSNDELNIDGKGLKS
jgi:hypothetical protein